MRKLIFSVVILSHLLLLISCTSWRPEKKLMLIPVNTSSGQELTARYFGASSILISDGDTSILIDGFFSRPSIGNALINGMKPNYERVSKFLKEHNIDRIDVMLLSHSHYDHILDSGSIAHINNAIVYGSKSAIDIVDKQKEPLRTRIIRNKQTVNAGLFSITFYETPHVPKKVTTKLFERVYLALSGGLDYRHLGKNYSFLISHKNRKILVIPSAGYEANILSGVKANVVFLSVGLLGKNKKTYIKNYWNETVVKTEATLVIPIHWDNLSGTSLTPSPYPIDNLKKSIKEITALSKSGDSKDPIAIKFPSFSIPFSLDD